MEDVKQRIETYLASFNLLSFATADEKGNPFVRSVEYVNDGATLYFVTDPTSTKVQHIKKNPNIAFTVDEDLADWSQIQGIQMRGMAAVVEDKEEKTRAMDMLLAKFPQIAELPSAGFEPCIVRIKPTTGVFIDNPAGFGTRYDVQFS